MPPQHWQHDWIWYEKNPVVHPGQQCLRRRKVPTKISRPTDKYWKTKRHKSKNTKMGDCNARNQLRCPSNYRWTRLVRHHNRRRHEKQPLTLIETPAKSEGNQQSQTNQGRNGVDVNAMLVDDWRSLAKSSQPGFKDSFFHSAIEATIYTQQIKRLIKCKQLQAGRWKVTWRTIYVVSYYLNNVNNTPALSGKKPEWHFKPRSVILLQNCATAATVCPSFNPHAYSRNSINTMPHVIDGTTVSAGSVCLKVWCMKATCVST